MVDNIEKKKVLIVHPYFRILGGAELVALRIIALVVQRYHARITVLTYEGFDVNKMMEYFRLSDWSNQIEFKPVRLPLFLRLFAGKYHTLKIAYLHRIAKKICIGYDICISTYNEIDFGKTGLQYIHHPNFASRTFMRNLNMTGLTDIRETFPFFDHLYRLSVRLTGRQSTEGIKRNITVVNSYFMESIINNLYGIKPNVVYPFLYLEQNIRGLAWEERKFQFLSVGRISPEKNFLDLLLIYESIARKYPASKFIILGRSDDQRYLDELRDAADKIKTADIEILPDAANEKRLQLYQESKFYIHSKPYEHFGISILEAASGGCLTFIPDSGGMKEIVAPDVLRYKDVNDLIENLTNLIADAGLRNNTLETLKLSVNNFTVENFDHGIESAINNLIEHL